MKKTTKMKTLVFVGIFAVMAVPVLLRAADDYRRPCGPPSVPPCFAADYDEDKDGRLSEAEEKKAHEAFLKLYDKDRDGKVSGSEFDAVRADGGKRLFARADTNKDGKLTLEEFNAARPDCPRGGKGYMRGGRGAFMGGKGRPCCR
ncbi:MAG TPA: EF-hand domain-containing protein [Deltaproteobacteria bacterium]|jgi:hypothetical protein|nr:EF-hand domain-containing protein [Deltaproteobacteria bacterium]HOI05654.1 EF-hand domain-containing protein [Deltaproteobacteria bacterium]